MAPQTKQKNTTEMDKTARAILRNIRIAPRKMRLVAHSIKNMDVARAQAHLSTHERRAAVALLKLLNSAISNARNKSMDEAKLIVQEIRVDGGTMLKRWMPRAQGRATPIQKKTSHVTLVLQESQKSVQSAFVVAKKEKQKKEKVQTEKPKTKLDAKEEKKQEAKTETKIEQKTQDKGFMKKVFRRKSI